MRISSGDFWLLKDGSVARVTGPHKDGWEVKQITPRGKIIERNAIPGYRFLRKINERGARKKAEAIFKKKIDGFLS